MANITLSDLLSLLFTDLAATAERAEEGSGLKIQVTDLDLNIPAYLRLQEAGADPEQNPPRFLLTLPSTRDSIPTGGLGRIALTIGVQSVGSPEQPAPPEDP
ncbi:hypothetical protein POL68_19905 [Stigmatella sp. ncwal1]|uniref:Uncharacterized protein n=1 Tax=Stigmatella ashevillensis TaxID=2995309 RepID=A0ABT5DB45_9BACT|nr:hypothetical protein [Stigmatella ashevillena]MDC0710751.1 hypothetical protein [Stigmatella ashevillena]